MDSLYKVCKYINTFNKNVENAIPISIYPSEIFFDASKINSDLYVFDELYKQKKIESFELAVSLYTGLLLFDDYYDWTAELEAYYDIKYHEMLNILIEHFERTANHSLTVYYKEKLNF